MKTTVYLIRHGETDWNLNGRWQGHTDVPLNDIGLQQAKRLAQRLYKERVHFDVLYSSDLTRAYQTAWEIGAVLKVAVELLPPRTGGGLEGFLAKCRQCHDAGIDAGNIPDGPRATARISVLLSALAVLQETES